MISSLTHGAFHKFFKLTRENSTWYYGSFHYIFTVFDTIKDEYVCHNYEFRLIMILMQWF